LTVEDAPDEREWLETDGAGGFASGTVGLLRTRRYHALLLHAVNPPTDRFVLVNGLEAWVETPAGRFPISAHRYSGGTLFPDGSKHVDAFTAEPWPRWTFRLPDGTVLEQEVVVSRETGATVLSWSTSGGDEKRTLEVRLLLSGRDFHALHHENASFRFHAEARGSAQMWRPYDSVPAIAAHTNGVYVHDPVWYRDFLYSEEAARGLDDREDLASPGRHRFDLSRGPAAMVLEAGGAAERVPGGTDAGDRAQEMNRIERARRSRFATRLERSADDYIVRRGTGKTIIAGYPWFADWGRDTFISLRGLCLTTGRLADARAILIKWADAVSEGLLPNRFPDHGQEPEYNSVDASLWYVIAVHEYLAAVKLRGATEATPEHDRLVLVDAVGRILDGYAVGTRYGIHADSDGLLSAGVPGVQLTWMDARVDGRVITPRIGKPVEIQALWINALSVGRLLSNRWAALARRARESFSRRFWREEEGCLSDVVDCDHVPGTSDPSFRPNQIFAVGGLPFPVLSPEQGRRVVDAVEKRLWTPVGLRSLGPGEPGYRGRYAGGVVERDEAYHQGTVWPWLIGPFVEAWVRVRGGGDRVRREARERFLAPILSHLDTAGLGHISEVADGDPPHRPGGCPFQAWSVAEVLRLDEDVLRKAEASVNSADRESPLPVPNQPSPADPP
jgi:predicted glycogen debranching enzyme